MLIETSSCGLQMEGIICGIRCSESDKMALQTVCEKINDERLNKYIGTFGQKDIPREYLEKQFRAHNEDVNIFKMCYDDNLTLYDEPL